MYLILIHYIIHRQRIIHRQPITHRQRNSLEGVCQKMIQSKQYVKIKNCLLKLLFNN
ncbi:MAG: hypothetical protein JWQ54_2532 [Mucilaginibacter sp.]|nr:hypothetical protein [Mucilaginibacter sp.]